MAELEACATDMLLKTQRMEAMHPENSEGPCPHGLDSISQLVFIAVTLRGILGLPLFQRGLRDPQRSSAVSCKRSR